MSLLSLIYRTAGAWGAGKGSNLTAAEFDQNNYDIQLAVNDLTNNPIQPHQIEDVDLVGDQLTFTLDDATVLGPVTIPVASIAFRGAFQPTTEYKAADMFTATDPTTDLDGLYFTNRDFESGLAFDPDLGIGIGGPTPYASFVMPINTRVRIQWFWPIKPGAGLHVLESSGDFAPMFSFIATDVFTLRAGLPGAVGNLRVGPLDGTTTYVLRKGGVEIGSVYFNTFETFANFTFAADVTFFPGDVLTLDGPATIDSAAECLTLALLGKLFVEEPSSS